MRGQGGARRVQQLTGDLRFALVDIQPGRPEPAIAAYEAEMNVVMYANSATVMLRLNPQGIKIALEDKGPGIHDIELAMQEGYSTATDQMREMGFGAGMGLPNIKRNADSFQLKSTIGKGTSYKIFIDLGSEEKT